MIYREGLYIFRNLQIRNRNSQDPDEQKATPMGAEAEAKHLLNEVAPMLTPAAVGLIAAKPTVRSKTLEFSAKVMGIPPPDNSSQTNGWMEHPIVKLARDEVNTRFSDMPMGPETEKRLGCPTPAQAPKALTTVATDVLTGTEMHKLPHALRSEIPSGSKIETVDPKSKIPKQVEDETPAVLWNAIRNK